MNRSDFKKLVKLRLKETKVLLDSKRYEGAYYLAGYAIECALKACIAKKTRRYEFPPKESNRLYTHELETLIRLAGLQDDFNDEMKKVKEFRTNWTIVKDWKEVTRYETEIDEKRANNLYIAITTEPNGVLSWLKKYW